MNIMVLVPKVVKGYIAKFPEVTHNAYPYFNYDNRVVEERVERGDCRAPYKVADDFTDEDYDELVKYARTLLNPILTKYSSTVANEDALHMAIRSFKNGCFDGKVNANRFAVLLKGMSIDTCSYGCPVISKDKKQKSEKPAEPKQDTLVKPIILKQLGIMPKEVNRKRQRGGPYIPKDR